MTASPEPRLDRLADAADDVAVLELSGELDLAVADRFRALVDTVAATPPRLALVDITAVGFMDSTVLRELLRAHRELDEVDSQLVVVGAQPAVRRLLELTGTNAVFRLTETRAEALNR